MRVGMKALILSAVVAVVLAPTPARADGYVSPFVGVNFANNSGDGRANFGVNAGGMGAGVIGAELDLGYAPSFFGNQGTFGSNYVFDLMGNLIVGIPVGGTHGAGVRPYGTIGVGLLRSQVTGGVNGLTQISNNDWGMNAGAGVMGFLSDHVGLRGDVRYFRNFDDNSTLTGPNGVNIDFGAFHFWRASFGVVLR
jgi:Outer membrane protein beta-barrel domain